MSAALIADRYARAAAAAIADNAELETALADIRAFAQAYESLPELRSVLENPAISPVKRRDIFDRIVNSEPGHPVAKRLLATLVDRGRIEIVQLVADALNEKVDERLNRARAQVTSADELDGGQLNRIQAGLERWSGKSIALETDRAPDLLGGVIVRMGSTVIDGSLRARLERIRSALLTEETT